MKDEPVTWTLQAERLGTGHAVRQAMQHIPDEHLVLVLYGGLLWLTWWRVASAPTGFIPIQDQGYLLINVQLPDSASVQRTNAILSRIDVIARRVPGVAHTVGVSGESFLTSTNGPNLGTMFLGLKPFEERGPAEYDEVIAAKIQQQCNQEIEGGIVSVFRAPPIQGPSPGTTWQPARPNVSPRTTTTGRATGRCWRNWPKYPRTGWDSPIGACR